MYVAMLLTDWYVSLPVPLDHYIHDSSPLRNIVSKRPISGPVDPDFDVYIGRSEVAMWMRVVSGWICMVLYLWSLLAPVLLPDRYVCSFCPSLSWLTNFQVWRLLIYCIMFHALLGLASFMYEHFDGKLQPPFKDFNCLDAAAFCSVYLATNRG